MSDEQSYLPTKMESNIVITNGNKWTTLSISEISVDL